MNNYTIERDIEIAAPVEVVWRTITEPELIRTWFADAEVEARPGAVGSLTFRADTDRMDMADDDKQKFLEEHRHGWQVQGDRLRDLFVAGHPSSA